MQIQVTWQIYEMEQHAFGGGSSGSTPQAPSPTPPPPTPPPPQAAPTQQTPNQSGNVNGRLYAADGQQSTVLTSNVNTSQGVVKKTILGC